MTQPELPREPYFDPRDGFFAPRPHARSPWSADMLHGRVVAGLLGREIEIAHGDPAFQFTRLTVDMFRVPPMKPLEVRSELTRDGNRIRVAAATLWCEGVQVAQASGVLLRRGEEPAGEVWSPQHWDMPHPDDVPGRPGLGGEIKSQPREGGLGFGKRAWMRETIELVAGEPLTPFLRAALAVDFVSPLANAGSDGLEFLNADVTLYLHRDPKDVWIGFDVTGHESSGGVGLGACTLYDLEGAIGYGVVCAVANRRSPEMARQRS